MALGSGVLFLALGGCLPKPGPTPELRADCASSAYVDAPRVVDKVKSIRVGENLFTIGAPRSRENLLRDWQLDFVEVDVRGEFVERISLARAGHSSCAKPERIVFAPRVPPAGYCLVIERDQKRLADASITQNSDVIRYRDVAHTAELWQAQRSSGETLARIRDYVRSYQFAYGVRCSRFSAAFPADPLKRIMEAIAEPRMGSTL